jgi:hypothetical protein
MSEAVGGAGGPGEDLPEVSEAVRILQAPREWSRERGGDLAESYLPDLSLPGFGESYPDCGEDRLMFCRDCGEPTEIGRTCKRSVCPRCAAAWDLHRAKAVVGKLDATARMMSAESGGTSVKHHHLVLSPPDGLTWEAEDPLGRAWEVVRDLLHHLGAEGIGVYHPFRGSEGDDLGAWKERLFQGRSWDDVRGELDLSPHFHLIVAAPWIPGGSWTETLESETGWVLHRIADSETGVSLGSLSDLAGATTYALSHAGIDESGENNSAQYRYFGSTLHRAEVFEDLQAQADRAVRSVAPRTLGLPSREVACQSEVAPEDRRDTGADTSRYLEELDGSSGCTETATAETTAEPVELVTCGGGYAQIEEAEDYLGNPVWVSRASKSERLRERWERWRSEPPVD